MILKKIISNDISKKISLEGSSFWSDGTPDNTPSFSDNIFKLTKNNKRIWSHMKYIEIPEYHRVFNLELKISFEEDVYGVVKSFISFTPVSDFFSEEEIYAMCSEESFGSYCSDEQDEPDDFTDFSSVNYVGGTGKGMHYSSESIFGENENIIANTTPPISKQEITSNLKSMLKILNIRSDDFYKSCESFIDKLFLIRDHVFKSYYFCTVN